MEWEKSLETGIPAIDAQHRRLFSLCDDLELSFQHGLPSNKVQEVLETLHFYTIRHFSMEEKHMRESGYPGLGEQQEAHKEFIKRLQEITTAFQKTGLNTKLANRLKNEMDNWLKDHVLRLDRQFSIYCQTNKTTS
jgi:hemerythrin